MNNITKESLISKTLETLSKLPNNKIEEVSLFTEFILKRYEEDILQKGMEKLSEESKSMDFLKTEEDIYTHKK